MPVALWTSPAFVAEARSWVVGGLDGQGSGELLTGEWEQPRARPWSSAIRFETTSGRVWFKVNGPGTRHEARLTRVLADLVPDLVPQVLTVDDARGWSLLRDAGPTLRLTWPPEELWSRWERLLARYAEAQRTLAVHEDAVLAAGVPDQRPSLLPTYLAELVARLARTPVEDGGLTREETARLESLMPEYDDWCAELGPPGSRARSTTTTCTPRTSACLPAPGRRRPRHRLG